MLSPIITQHRIDKDFIVKYFKQNNRYHPLADILDTFPESARYYHQKHMDNSIIYTIRDILLPDIHIHTVNLNMHDRKWVMWSKKRPAPSTTELQLALSDAMKHLNTLTTADVEWSLDSTFYRIIITHPLDTITHTKFQKINNALVSI